MDLLIKAIFTKAAAAGIAAAIGFSSPAFQIQKDRLVVSGSLNGIITKKVQRIARTGAFVSVTFTVSVIVSEKNDERIITRRFVHSFRYDPLQGNYLVRTPAASITVPELSSVDKVISEYRVELPWKGMKPETVDAYIEADIAYDSALNLDISGPALWDFYIPSRKIRGLTPEALR